MSWTPRVPRRRGPLSSVCMVVTLASASSRYGGPFDIAREQASMLTSAGLDVELVAGWTQGDLPTARAGETLRRVRRWLPSRDFTALLSWGLIRQLWTSIGRADVVHVSFAREAVPIVAALIAMIRRKPVVAQPHGMLTARSSQAHLVLDALLRPLMARVDGWIALTDVEADALRSRFGSALRDVTAVGNPVSLDREAVDRILADHPVPERSAVFIARLHPRKRVLDFAESAASAARLGLPEQYRVFGPDQGDLRALMERVEALPNLSYGGRLDSSGIPAFLAASGAFVLTSEAEPWGNVLAVAVTLGVPVVLTASSALAATLEGDPGVYVVEDGDPDGIAVAVHAAVTAGRVAPSTRFDLAATRDALLDVLAAATRTAPVGHALPAPAVR